MSGMYGRRKYDKCSKNDTLMQRIASYTLFSGTKVNPNFNSDGHTVCKKDGTCISFSGTNQGLGPNSISSRVDVENSLKSGKKTKINTVSANPYVYSNDLVKTNLRC